LLLGGASGFFDGFANANIGSAAAQVATHAFVNIVICRCGNFAQKRYCTHDLAGLAVTTLWHFKPNPSLAHRIGCGPFKTFDGNHFLVAYRTDWRNTRSPRLAANVHCARAALRDTAAVLCACELKVVAKNPQKRRVIGDINIV
tara:strand:+ start:29498 stop:29929 length:432 start_codon:yes stop_codon:yes gene_type:complete